MYRHISVLDVRLFCSGFQNGICLRIKSADSGNSNYPKSMIGFAPAEHPMITHLKKKNRMPSKSGLWDNRFYRMKT
nr:MAG TPA: METHYLMALONIC ACIDURIA AND HOMOCYSTINURIA TYPE PROTEIN.25A [Caudoviricetes sp.]